MKLASILTLAVASTVGATLANMTPEQRKEREVLGKRFTLAKKLHPHNGIKIAPFKLFAEEWRIKGDEVVLTPEEIEYYHSHGYLHLPPILTKAEVEEITEIYNGFLNKTFPVIDKDYGDMSLPFDAPESDYNMINVLLPRSYKPEIKGNIFEKRSASIVRQLFEGHKKPDSEEDLEMEIDFDQILAKKPGRNSAAFAWHQDMGYWPPAPKGVSTATATVSLALNEAHVENGCLILVEKSHTEGLRKHRPLMAKDNLEDIVENEKDKMDANDGVDVADGHALQTTLTDDDVVTHLPIAMGGVSIHDEWIVHGSPGNNHPTEWRHTYILAYREKEMIAQERKLGFTHSHNNKFQWDSFRKENIVDVEAPDGPKHTSAGPKHTEL